MYNKVFWWKVMEINLLYGFLFLKEIKLFYYDKFLFLKLMFF